ncbi:MAG: hypothetical protein PHY02_04815 [Phycisphaerae bacterium]|nr:hypothetical protein [Phycisphaerae bacterium]
MPELQQNSQTQDPDKKLEYITCIDFCKYSGGVQLAQISIFFALMSGFAYFLFGKDRPDESLLTILKFLASLVAFLLWFVEESHAYLASNFFCRAQELEKEIGFDAFSRLPKHRPFWFGPTNWAFRIVYCGFALFWFIVALSG